MQSTNSFPAAAENMVPATTGQRLVHFIVDLVVLYLILMVLSFIVLIIANADHNKGGIYFQELFFLFLLFVAVIYYAVCEGISKGRSVGKLITGSKVVRQDGTTIDWKDAVVRTLCRFIPFEAFSALGGEPWHDRMSKTKVVKVKK